MSERPRQTQGNTSRGSLPGDRPSGTTSLFTSYAGTTGGPGVEDDGPPETQNNLLSSASAWAEESTPVSSSGELTPRPAQSETEVLVTRAAESLADFHLKLSNAISTVEGSPEETANWYEILQTVHPETCKALNTVRSEAVKTFNAARAGGADHTEVIRESKRIGMSGEDAVMSLNAVMKEAKKKPMQI